MNSLKPKKRSRLRIFAGMLCYRCKRYMEWYFSGKKYSKVSNDTALQHTVFSHKTPLLRKLRNVDMWMQYNKVVNLRIALKRLDGTLIKPGETFSYWRLIGKPTRKKGYMDGMVLFNGRFGAGVGGGLCQLSNIIYWMALHTPLTVTERYRHGFDVFPDSNRTQPFGTGATCVYNYRDLQLYNDTKDTYQLKLYMDNEYLFGELKSTTEPKCRYEVYEKEHVISHEFWGGYVRHNTIYRRTYGLDDTLKKDEFIAENHAVMMYQPFLSESSCNITLPTV